MSARPSPTPEEISGLAAQVNRIVLRGQVACAQSETMDLMHTAHPGKPGLGLRQFESHLHPAVTARTREDGAWLFYRRVAQRQHGGEEFGAINRSPDGRPAPDSEVKRRQHSRAEEEGQLRPLPGSPS